ncbi:Gamma-glutamyl phosphate reductase [Pediococcus damnosus]|nr:Gamma-glutamyl phosphate reductase [Pediococcus damnosus]
MMTLTEMGKRAQAAEQRLSQLSTVKKNRVLKTMANQVRQATPEILKANAIDMQNAEKNGVRKVMLDRLQLDDARVNSMAAGLEQAADLADPIGEVLKGWTTEAGLEISQV